MTEPQITKPVDLASEGSPFAGILGEPLVVDVSMKDGRLTPESLRAIGDLVSKRMAERGAPARMIDRLREQVTGLLESPERQDAIIGQSVLKKRARIEGAIQSARMLIDDLPERIREIGSLKSDTFADRNEGHQFAYQLGMAAGAVLSATSELMAALETLEHAFECECVGKPTTEPTTPEASPDAP